MASCTLMLSRQFSRRLSSPYLFIFSLSLSPLCSHVRAVGVVEQARSGSTLRILLVNSMDSTQLQLAGIRAPGISGSDDTAEPFAREARFFTEHLLLHRDVVVTIE